MLLVSCVTFVGRTWLLSFPVHPNKRSAASNSARASSSKQARWWCAHYHQKSEGYERHWHQAACASIQVRPGSGCQCYSARGQYARPWEPSVLPLRDYASGTRALAGRSAPPGGGT